VKGSRPEAYIGDLRLSSNGTNSYEGSNPTRPFSDLRHRLHLPYADTDTTLAIVLWGAMDSPDNFGASMSQTSREELLHNAVTMARFIGGVSPSVGLRTSQVGIVAQFRLEALVPVSYSQHFDHCFCLGRPSSHATPTGEDPWFTTVDRHRCTHKVVDGRN
jgi:hypothetical protein